MKAQQLFLQAGNTLSMSYVPGLPGQKQAEMGMLPEIIPLSDFLFSSVLRPLLPAGTPQRTSLINPLQMNSPVRVCFGEFVLRYHFSLLSCFFFFFLCYYLTDECTQ